MPCNRIATRSALLALATAMLSPAAHKHQVDIDHARRAERTRQRTDACFTAHCCTQDRTMRPAFNTNTAPPTNLSVASPLVRARRGVTRVRLLPPHSPAHVASRATAHVRTHRAWACVVEYPTPRQLERKARGESNAVRFVFSLSRSLKNLRALQLPTVVGQLRKIEMGDAEQHSPVQLSQSYDNIGGLPSSPPPRDTLP